jgi:hypothetical protein
MKNVTKITWKHIEGLNWGDKLNYSRISQEVWSTYTPETIRRMQAFVCQKQKELLRRYNLGVKSSTFASGFSDDGLSDVTAHVIGLGKKEYEKNLANPGLLNERTPWGTGIYGTKEGYKESFLYCFHRPPSPPKKHQVENLLDFKVKQICDEEGVPSVLLAIAIYCRGIADECKHECEQQAWIEDSEAIDALQALIRRNEV